MTKFPTEACLIMLPRTQYDGWWEAEDLLKQVKERALPIILSSISGKQALFDSDNTMQHCAFAPDPRRENRITLGPADEFLVIGSTTWGEENQSMIFPKISPNLAFHGQPKCIKTFLQERSLWQEEVRLSCWNKCEVRKTFCCERKVMKSRANFVSQQVMLEKMIVAARHLVILYAKFNCELKYYSLKSPCLRRNEPNPAIYKRIRRYMDVGIIGVFRIDFDLLTSELTITLLFVSMVVNYLLKMRILFLDLSCTCRITAKYTIFTEF